MTSNLGAAILIAALMHGCRSDDRAPAAAPQSADSAAVPSVERRENSNEARPRRDLVRQRKCMGTMCDWKAFHHDEALVDRAFSRGFDEMDRLEALMSSWRPDSEISRVNDAAGNSAVSVSEDTYAVVTKGLWVSALAAGAFDITVGVFRGVWKFDEDSDGSLPDPKVVARRRRLVGWRHVVADPRSRTVMLGRKGQRLNVEGIAKGYAIDTAVRAIRAEGLRDFIAHAGGDLFASGRHGDRPWKVGIQDPRGPRGRIIFELPIEDQAFNTSGDYERFILKDGVRHHHILDARTGMPARKSRSVTILAEDAFTADLLDTAVFVLGPTEGMKMIRDLPGVEAVIVGADNRVHVTSGLRGRLVKRGDPSPGP